MNKKILRAKEAEITKAGRMVFDALFGDSDEFERKLEEEIADTQPEPGVENAISVEVQSFVRCAACGREHAVPANVDVRTVEQLGWRFDAEKWKCGFCSAR